MRQYDIWRVSLPPPVGRRPVLLLSRNSAHTALKLKRCLGYAPDWPGLKHGEPEPLA